MLTVRVFESGGEIQSANLPRASGQPPSNAPKHTARRLPCPGALRRFRSTAFRTGMPAYEGAA
jgi:hypothetical protein